MFALKSSLLNKEYVLINVLKVEVEVEVNLQPIVCLGVRRPSGTRDQFFFLLEISFRHLRVCYFVAPSLTRGRVCNILYNCFWALPEQLLLGRSPAELTTIFCCLSWDSSNLEGQIPVFISPRNSGGDILTRLHMGLFWRLLKLKLIYDRQSVGQSVLVSGTHLGPVTNFSFSPGFEV
jgi:hypothetical protein